MLCEPELYNIAWEVWIESSKCSENELKLKCGARWEARLQITQLLWWCVIVYIEAVDDDRVGGWSLSGDMLCDAVVYVF